MFGLPTRLIAKKFVFRLMYGGSAYSYANDPDFTFVSTSEKFWQKVIDKFYDKYVGLSQWHTKIVQEVTQTGQLVMPTGRIYTFERNNKGEWPVTTIKNYPVQGLGADVMAMIRVSFMKRFKHANLPGYLVNTVHDSIVLDIPQESKEEVVQIFNSVFLDFPVNFERFFGVKFDLPLRCEISVGNNMKELTEVE
jgi:DNA polymerase I-like protein with 3'-5' exonuclease and polymerase domains